MEIRHRLHLPPSHEVGGCLAEAFTKREAVARQEVDVKEVDEAVKKKGGEKGVRNQ